MTSLCGVIRLRTLTERRQVHETDVGPGESRERRRETRSRVFVSDSRMDIHLVYPLLLEYISDRRSTLGW